MKQIKNKDLLFYVASKIKKLRNEADITQEQFYDNTKIHIARIESGELNISISTLAAICKSLNITLADFFRDM